VPTVGRAAAHQEFAAFGSKLTFQLVGLSCLPCYRLRHGHAQMGNVL
jgi:hypothetical protein